MWERISRLVSKHPLAILGVSLLVLVAPTLALSGLQLSYDIPAELPPESDSVQGIRTLEKSFGAGQVQPVVLIVRSGESIWNDPAFQAIDDLTVNLEKVPGVSGVRSITRPTEGGVSPKRMKSLGLGGLAELTEQLPRARLGQLVAFGQGTGGLELVPRAGRGVDASTLPRKHCFPPRHPWKNARERRERA
jgi:uncharacterized membrane protein YdfJ with MMPL/SSD domain